MALPIKLPLDLMQTRWKQELDPLLAISITQGQQLSGIFLKSGVNTINHLLSRMQQGWFVTDQNAAAIFFRSQPFNDKTLVLTASAPVTVNLWVF